MQKDEVLPSGDLLIVGADYYVKLTDGQKVIAKYVGHREVKGFSFNSRTTHRYDFENKSTGRAIRVKSKIKILRPV